MRSINQVFRDALRERERIRTGDLPHPIFQVGTGHIAEPKFPGQAGYLPAGIFTADLRELDYHRSRGGLFPQVVGHTASKTGQIRHAPGSWTRRDFIAIDVGRHAGAGNGGLLLTDFGWLAVTPGGPARLVEASALLVGLAHQAAREQGKPETDEVIQERMRQAIAGYARTATTARRAAGQHRGKLLVGLPPGELLALDDFFRSVEHGGRCVVMTDLDSQAGYDTIDRVRSAVRAVPGAGALVGGNTAVNLDWQRASAHDRNVIIPLILAVVFVILGLLLRALVAPLVLTATVVLSFAAALGVSAFFFNHVFGFGGADTSFPLFVFVFLVALGIDYNIFLMTRVREEAIRRDARHGAIIGLAATGGVITSAGFVLAGTFAVLATVPVTFLTELGFAVAFGILLDTIVVRSVLVTALNLDLGRWMWWPSTLARKPDPAPAELGRERATALTAR